MKSHIFLILLLLSAFRLAGGAGAIAQPGVPPAGTNKVSGSAPDSFNLELQRIGGGLMVRMQDLFEVIHKLDPAAGMRWDPVSKAMRFEADGKRLDILSPAPALLINGKPRRMAHPVLIRQDKVYIPVETVQVLLSELGIEFDPLGNGVADRPPPTTAQAAAPTTASAPTAPVPAEPAVPLSVLAPSDGETTAATSAAAPAPVLEPDAAAPAAPATPTPAGPVVVPKINETSAVADQNKVPAGDQIPLDPPSALAGKIGLSWGQLADLSHHAPPRRVTLVYDRPLEGVAQEVRQSLQNSLSIEVVLVPAPAARRSDEDLVARVQSTSPELVVDLLAVGAPDRGGEDPPSMVVWVAHEALWPQDQEAKPNSDAEILRYRRHQFQSLALGSLLRTELGRQFPNAAIDYELAPSYLLRRLDAPSAEVLIPGAGKADSARAPLLATAVSAAIEGYIRGMGKVQF